MDTAKTVDSDKTLPAGSQMLLINRVAKTKEASGSGDNEWVMACQMGDNC